jgi:hypothetical protein
MSGGRGLLRPGPVVANVCTSATSRPARTARSDGFSGPPRGHARRRRPRRCGATAAAAPADHRAARERERDAPGVSGGKGSPGLWPTTAAHGRRFPLEERGAFGRATSATDRTASCFSDTSHLPAGPAAPTSRSTGSCVRCPLPEHQIDPAPDQLRPRDVDPLRELLKLASLQIRQMELNTLTQDTSYILLRTSSAGRPLAW